MAILIQGLEVDYAVTSSALSRTPAESYAAWATELGVSSTASLYANLNGDDAALPIDYAAPPTPGGITKGFLSSEGGLGWYTSGAPSGSIATAPSGVSKFYQLSPLPPFLLVFHPQVDCQSAAVKLQKSGATTIINGEIRSLSGTTQVTEFSARFNGSADWQLDVRVVSGTLPLAFFAYQPQWNNRPAALQNRTDLATVTVGNSLTLIGVVSPGTLVPSEAPTFLIGVPLRKVTYPIPQAHLTTFAQPVPLLSVWHSGKGRITGTVKEAGTPNHAVRRRVRLHRMIDGMLVREVWSDPVTGAYEFNNIDPAYKFYVVSHDHILNYNAVIKDNLTPEPMP